MNKYLLDTDICIFLLKDKFGLKDKIKSVGIDNCYVSEISMAELFYGVYKSARYEKHIKETSQIQDLFTILPISNCLKSFGKEKARLVKLGKKIPDFDLLIGVTAVQNGMKMVTNNEKHLVRIANIQIENWINPRPKLMWE